MIKKGSLLLFDDQRAVVCEKIYWHPSTPVYYKPKISFEEMTPSASDLLGWRFLKQYEEFSFITENLRGVNGEINKLWEDTGLFVDEKYLPYILNFSFNEIKYFLLGNMIPYFKTLEDTILFFEYLNVLGLEQSKFGKYPGFFSWCLFRDTFHIVKTFHYKFPDPVEQKFIDYLSVLESIYA
ncbi:MAG: hypothetical protein ACRCYP_04290 [Alphaproteobacteria bacterium]